MVLINKRMLPHDLTFNPWLDLFIPKPTQLPGEHTAEMPFGANALSIQQLHSQLDNDRYPFTPGWRECNLE